MGRTGHDLSPGLRSPKGIPAALSPCTRNHPVRLSRSSRRPSRCREGRSTESLIDAVKVRVQSLLPVPTVSARNHRHPRRDRRTIWILVSRSVLVGVQAIIEAFLGQRPVIDPSNRFQLSARKWNLRSTSSRWTPLQGDLPHCRSSEPRRRLDRPIQYVQPVFAQCVSESIEEEIAEQSEEVFHAFRPQLSNN